MKVIEKPEPPKVDKSKLEKFYKECLAYYKEADYSKGNWKKYQKALADAKAVLEDEDATQEEVNKALKALIEITQLMNKENAGSSNPSNPPKAPEVPKTGDTAPWLPLTMLLILAGGTAIIVVRRRKRAK